MRKRDFNGLEPHISEDSEMQVKLRKIEFEQGQHSTHLQEPTSEYDNELPKGSRKLKRNHEELNNAVFSNESILPSLPLSSIKRSKAYHKAEDIFDMHELFFENAAAQQEHQLHSMNQLLKSLHFEKKGRISLQNWKHYYQENLNGLSENETEIAERISKEEGENESNLMSMEEDDQTDHTDTSSSSSTSYIIVNTNL
jgi:hypothetical protein